jgi:serine protease
MVMRLRVLLASFALLLASLSFTALSPARADVYSDPSYLGQPVVGLVIKYQPGVIAFDAFGNQVGLTSELTKGLDVGLGMYSAKFSNSLDEETALSVANEVANNPAVESVYLDHFLDAQFFESSTPKLGVLKASSAPFGLSAQDAWLSTNPTNARVTLSWRQPTQLNGGYLWGYRISKYDPVTKTYIDLVSNTKSKLTSISISNGLVAGATARFKVAAITKSLDSKYMAVSAASSIVSVVPTATPQKPVLQSAGNITSTSPQVTWAYQGKVERGGLPVNYSVSAIAADQSQSNCSSSGTSCTLSGLQAGKKYQVRVTATNARGSATSDLVYEAEDPMMDLQWYLDSSYGINVSNAWKVTKGSPDVVVAVVDTGITTHPDLVANVVTGYDFISSTSNSRDGNGRDADPSDPGDYSTVEGTDSSWHGTHVAGIIAAESNSIGISGVAPNVKISPVRVLGVNGGTESDIAAGINWAIGVKLSGVPTNQYPAKVVNLSIGSSSFSTCYSNSPTQLAIDESKRRNVTLVTAAGNDNHLASSSYPGNCYGNITIGATGYTGDRAYYSNYSGYSRTQQVYIGVDISAPGGDDRAGLGAPAGGEIWSTLNDGKTTPGNPTYGKEEGTSMASPVAAGVVALMYSVRPSLTDDQVWEILSSTARSFKSDSDCTYQLVETQMNDGSTITTGLCGVGIIDAGAAVAAVQKLNK